jgi:hypothetical protein
MSEPVVGRTGWDVLANASGKILLILIIAGIGVALFFGYQYIDIDIETIEAVVIGILFGYILANYFSRDTGRFILVVPENFEGIRLLFMTETFFSQFNQPTNVVCTISWNGHPLYIANAIDMWTRTITYGWLSEDLPVRVAADRKHYVSWYKRAEAAMIDNLRIKNYPRIYGTEDAQAIVDELVDWLSVKLGFSSSKESKKFLSDILNKELPDEKDEVISREIKTEGFDESDRQ